MQPAYKRILLKLSGEVLAGKEGHGINFDTVSDVCKHVKKCSEMGVQNRPRRRRRKLLARPLQR